MNSKLLAFAVVIGYVIAAFIVFLLHIRQRAFGRLFIPIRFFIALFLAVVVITFILA